MSDDKKNPQGPVGDHVRRNVERLREARGGLTYRQLSELLEQHGRSIPPLGLSRIEKGTRRVDADDLVALSVVLRVNPNALLLPFAGSGNAEITGAGTVPARDVWQWAEGKRPLVIPDGDDGTAQADFQRNARPFGIRNYDGATKAGLEHLRSDAPEQAARFEALDWTDEDGNELIYRDGDDGEG